MVGSGRVSAEMWEEGHEPSPLLDYDVNNDDEYEERAAIMEFEAGLAKEDAEREAAQIVGRVDIEHR